MDNLCHSLVGAALAECGLRKRTRYATAALVIGANFPDIDVLALFGDNALGFRRGITHGIPALILLPFVLTGILMVWNRAFPRRGRPERPPLQPPLRPVELLKLSAVAIITHPTLDWMNTYGMRWLMPFDGTWTSADALFIIDPWLYLMLGAAWIVGSSYRRSGLSSDGLIVSTSHRLGSRGERFARLMTRLAAVYIAAMMGLSAFGRSLAARQLGLENPTRTELMISPVFLDSWRRQVTAEVDGAYRFGAINWRQRQVEVHPEPMLPQLELLDGQPHSIQLDALLDWARFPYARREGSTIHVDDARYARRGRSFAGVTIVVER
jgi:inner membrane protein